MENMKMWNQMKHLKTCKDKNIRKHKKQNMIKQTEDKEYKEKNIRTIKNNKMINTYT